MVRAVPGNTIRGFESARDTPLQPVRIIITGSKTANPLLWIIILLRFDLKYAGCGLSLLGAQPNGSRLSCGRNARGRASARWFRVWSGAQPQFYHNTGRPSAPSAC